MLSVFLTSCGENDETSMSTKETVFEFINEQTSNYIAVYGSKTITEDAYNRAYHDVKNALDNMDNGIKQGLLNAGVKMLVVSNEDELENNIDYFITLLPVEAIYTDNEGRDETLSTSTDVGLSSTKLELMYLCVYYSLLTESNLSAKYSELSQAYNQAANSNIFTPEEAYQDGYIDEIHQNASDKHALKYGSYLYNSYKVYFGNDAGVAGEFSITTKSELQTQNPLGYAFIMENFE